MASQRAFAQIWASTLLLAGWLCTERFSGERKTRTGAENVQLVAVKGVTSPCTRQIRRIDLFQCAVRGEAAEMFLALSFFARANFSGRPSDSGYRFGSAGVGRSSAGRAQRGAAVR